MAERPIIFSAPMIRALLDGRKTMTRQLAWRETSINREPAPGAITISNGTQTLTTSPWQKVRPGDRLWVREAWWHHKAEFIEQAGFVGGTVTLLDGGPASFHENAAFDPVKYQKIWKPRPSIHMPRWASRLTLTVTAVKVERLQEINEKDAIEEGARAIAARDAHPLTIFSGLWERLHGPGSWHTNPEVVAISFTVEKRNIDGDPRA